MGTIVNLTSFAGSDGQAIQTGDAGWIEHTSYTAGTAQLFSGRARQLGTTSILAYRTEVPGNADQTVAVNVHSASNPGASPTVSLGACARINTGANTFFYLQYLSNTATLNLNLYKFVAGTPTNIGPGTVGVTVTPPSAGTATELRLIVSGVSPNISVVAQWNGSTVMSVTVNDTNLDATGRVGIRWGSSPDSSSDTTGAHAASFFASDTTGGGDTTAPVLTSPTGTSTSSTTASGTVSTDEANGTLYRLASTNATESAATVKAAALTQTVTATGSQAVTFTGLTASTTYYAHYVHQDAAGNDSTRVSSTSFTTSASGDTTAPVLSSPTGTGAVLSATGTVSTNEGNGTLYFFCSANATETAATVVASGGSQAVTATGSQAVSFGAQTAGVRYAHYVHDDAATNRSARVSSSSFTVTAAGTITSSSLALNNGVLHVAAPFECYVNNATTGALLVKKTGLTSHATTAVVVFNDPAIAAGTLYSVRWRRTDTGAEGLERLTAT